MATPAQEACGNAMLRRSTYLVILAIIGLLTWTAATDLTAKILVLFMPSTLLTIGAITAGSETVAIMFLASVVGGLPALLVWTYQHYQVRRLIKSPESAEARMISGWDEAWARFAATFGMAERDRPNHVRACDPGVIGGPGQANAGLIRLDYAVAERLSIGPGRDPGDYDRASFVLLHELAHHRSGDADLSMSRDALAVTCAVLIAFGMAFMSARLLHPMFLVEIAVLTILGSVLLLALLRQVSRHMEFAADAWAARELLRVRGEAGMAAIIARVGKEFTEDGAAQRIAASRGDDAVGLPAALEHHPSGARRLEALLSRPRAWPLALLWIGTIVALVWLQAWQLDLGCNDCNPNYRNWYALLAWAITILMTVVVFRLRRATIGDGPDYRLLSRLGLALTLFLVYVATRIWLVWDTLSTTWHAQSPGIAIQWIFFSGEDYTLAMSLHLVLSAFILLWPIRGQAVTPEGQDHRAPSGWWVGRISIDGLLAECRRIILTFAKGISMVALASSSLMLAFLLLNGQIKLASIDWWMAILSTVTLVGVSGSAVFRLPKSPRAASAVLFTEAALLGALVCAADFLQRLQLGYIAERGFDPADPQAQVMVGALLFWNPSALWTPALRERAWSGFAVDILVTAVVVASLALMRLRNRPVAAEHGE